VSSGDTGSSSLARSEESPSAYSLSKVPGGAKWTQNDGGAFSAESLAGAGRRRDFKVTTVAAFLYVEAPRTLQKPYNRGVINLLLVITQVQKPLKSQANSTAPSAMVAYE
jgi:hypothetical protein